MRMFIAALVAVSAMSSAALAATEGAVIKLQAPAKVASMIQDGAAWRCTGDVCAAPQVKALPIGRACRKIVAELGAVVSFHYRGVELDAAGLADCNAAAKP